MNTAIALDNEAWAAQQPLVKEGSRGDGVKAFQQMYSNYIETLAVDGVFGSKTCLSSNQISAIAGFYS